MPLNLKFILLSLWLILSNCLASGQEQLSYDELFKEGIRLQGQRDFSESTKIFNQILRLDTIEKSPCLAPEVYVNIAYNLLDQGEKIEGERYIRNRIDTFEDSQCSDPRKKLRMYQCLFVIHREIDDINGSKEIIDEMLAYLNGIEGGDDHYLVQINKYYSDYYSDIGDNYTAILYAEKSMEIRRKLYKRTEYNYLSGLYSLANYTERIGDYDRSDRLLDTLINTLSDSNINNLKSRSYHMRSLIAIRKEEYDLAKTYADKALLDYTNLHGENSVEASFAYQELGTAYLNLGQLQEAITSYEKAHRIRRDNYGANHRLTLSSLSGYTKAKMTMGDTLSVIDEYKDIVANFTLNYSVGNADKYVINILNVGKLYQGAGLIDSAQVYFTKALGLCNEYYPDGNRLHWQTHQSLAAIGPLSNRELHIRSALYHATGDSSINRISKEQVTFSPHKQAILDILLQHAENLYQRFEETTKLEHLKELVSYAEQYDLIKNEIFNEYLTPKSIIKAAPNVRRLNLLRLRSNQILYDQTQERTYLDQALTSLNESKNLLLQVELFQKNLKSIIDIPDNLISKERELYNEINRIQSSESADSLRETLIDLERQYFDVRKNIVSSQRRLGEIKDQETLSTTAIRAQLSDGQLLINYFLDDGQLFIYYLSKESQGLEMKTFSQEEQSLIEQYISTVSEGIGADLMDQWNVGYRLFQLLIPSEIKEHINHLTIIPDNDLYLLPFDVLLTEPVSDQQGFTDFPFMINRYSIDYMAGIGDRYKISSPGAYGSAVGYAPFIDERVKRYTQLPLLAYSDDEIDNINEVYGIDGITGRAATKEHFLSQANNYDIIHIASHAVIDAEEPINSNILFYPNDSTDKNKLYLWELYNEEFPAKLAVLSSCQTSDGNPIKGAGVINIARGFYTAGAQAVISNLWPTQDYTASELMKGFYAELNSGSSETEALHEAKLSYKANQIGPLAHPKYWAGWIIQRSDLNSSMANATKRYIMITGALLTTLLLLFLGIKRAR